MRRLGVFIIGAFLSFLFIFGGYGVTARADKNEKIVYIGGMSAGFTLKTGGAQIIGMCDVVAETACIRLPWRQVCALAI